MLSPRTIRESTKITREFDETPRDLRVLLCHEEKTKPRSKKCVLEYFCAQILSWEFQYFQYFKFESALG